MKAREIRERCNGRVDPNVQYCLEALGEQFSVMQQQFVMLAQQLDQITNIISDFTVVAENLKNTAEAMKKVQGDEDDDGPTH